MKALLVGFVFSCIALQAGEVYLATVPPAVMHSVPPEYTAEAIQHGFEGIVPVSVMVKADGSPSELAVSKPAPFGLGDKAVECVRQWQFKPGTRDAQPVPVKVTVEVRFKLPEKPK